MPNRLRILTLAVITALCGLGAPAMTDTGNAVLSERVRSLQVRPIGADLAMPGPAVMVLDGPGGIQVDFDLIDDDRCYLRYELQHCNADWQPSQLAYIEYLDGFNEGTVEDYAFSQATTVHYVHYRITLPNDQVRITASGNYLLRVYDEADGPEHPMLQCRFVVSEQTAALSGRVTSRTDVDFNREHQQLELQVNLDRAQVRDPFNDVQLRIEQNGRTDNAAVLTKPLRASGKTLVYEHLPALIFPAGNEYRRFETVSVTYPGMGVIENEFHGPYYHAFLETAESRMPESYHHDQTLSGGYVVRATNASDQDTEADYMVTHFTLNYPETPGLDFFIDADFTHRRFSPESRMVFNRGTGLYELNMLLKQGSYSYQILAVPKGKDTGRTDVIEGNKYETRNLYTVYVYNRRPGERYDRLIGVYTLPAMP